MSRLICLMIERGYRLTFVFLVLILMMVLFIINRIMKEVSSRGMGLREYVTLSFPINKRIEGIIDFSQNWEENKDQGVKNLSWKTMNSYKVKDCQKPSEIVPEFISEDIGIPPTSSYKKKKASDPRFKRVINSEFRNDTDTEAEKLGSPPKLPQPLFGQTIEDQALNEKVISFLKIPNNMSLFTPPSVKESCRQDFSNEVTKDTDFHFPQKCCSSFDSKTYRCDNSRNVPNMDTFKELERIKSNFKATLKRSVSDCTLQAKKSFGQENEDEVSDKVRGYPSGTRLSKMHDWIKEFNMSPEKRRSVITVIGQTQTKPFSKILNEINQRRKLAKELDKHALCEAIMDSAEGQSEVKNLVAKVDLVLPDGKIIYSTEKVYLCKDNKFTALGVHSPNSMEILDPGEQKRRRSEMIPEKDSSVSQMWKKRTKRSSKKTASSVKEKSEDKGSLKSIYEGISTRTVWLLFGILCLSLCFSFFFFIVKPQQSYFLVDFFRPRTTAWYEKLLF